MDYLLYCSAASSRTSRSPRPSAADIVSSFHGLHSPFRDNGTVLLCVKLTEADDARSHRSHKMAFKVTKYAALCIFFFQSLKKEKHSSAMAHGVNHCFHHHTVLLFHCHVMLYPVNVRIKNFYITKIFVMSFLLHTWKGDNFSITINFVCFYSCIF